MVDIIHTPLIGRKYLVEIQEHYDIVGNNIEELIETALKFIKPQSIDFYKQAIRRDLENPKCNNWVAISHHSTYGKYYIVRLINDD